MAKLEKLLSGSGIFVMLYGFFIIISLFLQALIPFLNQFPQIAEALPILFNTHFELPMDVLTSFWAAISAAYVGADRAMFAIDGLRNGLDIHAFDADKRVQMIQVLIISFAIYSIAVLLNVIFEANFALSPLATSLGASVLCFVVGNKAISGMQKLSPEEDADGDGIRDTDQQIEAIKTALKDGKQITAIMKDGQIKYKELGKK
jgi:hypothetical protein